MFDRVLNTSPWSANKMKIGNFKAGSPLNATRLSFKKGMYPSIIKAGYCFISVNPISGRQIF